MLAVGQLDPERIGCVGSSFVSTLNDGILAVDRDFELALVACNLVELRGRNLSNRRPLILAAEHARDALCSIDIRAR